MLLYTHSIKHSIVKKLTATFPLDNMTAVLESTTWSNKLSTRSPENLAIWLVNWNLDLQDVYKEMGKISKTTKTDNVQISTQKKMLYFIRNLFSALKYIMSNIHIIGVYMLKCKRTVLWADPGFCVRGRGVWLGTQRIQGTCRAPVGEPGGRSEAPGSWQWYSVLLKLFRAKLWGMLLKMW